MKLFFKKVKYFFWDKPVSKPEKEKPIRVMGEQVFKDYVVVIYDGQKINLHKNELSLWNGLNRKDKRGMARKSKLQQAKGLIRFEMIDGKWICLKNKPYGQEKDAK
ncbi:MAG: hypothetical protein ABSA76_02300 [Bacteroidales bacterium]